MRVRCAVTFALAQTLLSGYATSVVPLPAELCRRIYSNAGTRSQVDTAGNWSVEAMPRIVAEVAAPRHVAPRASRPSAAIQGFPVSVGYRSRPPPGIRTS